MAAMVDAASEVVVVQYPFRDCGVGVDFLNGGFPELSLKVGLGFEGSEHLGSWAI